MDKHDHSIQIISLLWKYIDNRCDEQELHMLLNWLKSPEELHAFDSVSESLWDSLNEKYSYPDEKRISELTLEVDLLLKKIKTKQDAPKKRRHITFWIHFYRIASVILLLLAIGSGYFLMRDKGGMEKVSYMEVYAARGETEEYTLSDGTHIILNSESILKIPSDYNVKTRHVEMIGEGFFKVTPNPNKPFIVESGEAQVKVLGTSFNVKAYPDDNTIGVTVSTGKVLVKIPDMDLQLRVLPMERLFVDKKTSSLTKQTLIENNYTKWLEGILYFDKEPLNEVIKTICRKYDKDILLRCGNCNPLITGTHDNKSLDAVIEAICFTTGLKYREEGESIILYK